MLSLHTLTCVSSCQGSVALLLGLYAGGVFYLQYMVGWSAGSQTALAWLLCTRTHTHTQKGFA